ncbi:putative DNA-binding domain-containing protein [Leptospira sp. 96542]|nr:putative DNA-binding domain-containing protein [Leptospira sp. 96542]
MKLEKLQTLYSESILNNKDLPFQNQIAACGNLSLVEVTTVYKNAYFFRMKEVLADNFEAVNFALGGDLFNFATEKFIKKNNHNSYDLSDYGKNFPNFLIETYPDLPYLKNLAEFEVNFIDSFHKEEHRSFDFAEIQNKTDLENSTFLFGKTVKLIQNEFSIYPIWKNRKSTLQPDLSNIKNQEFLLLYKHDSNLYVLTLEPLEFYFINLLQKGDTIGSSLEKTGARFDLNPEIVAGLFGKIATSGIVTDIISNNI